MVDILFKYVIFYTDLGWMGATYSSKGLTKVILPCDSREKVLAKARVRIAGIENGENTLEGDLPYRLKLYLAGEPVDFVDKLDLDGATAFQKSVWNATQTIPYGETRSYGWVACKIKCNSARAVGQALGKNPLPIIIPCHRVIGSSGKLVGFGAGLKMKEHLLNLERTR